MKKRALAFVLCLVLALTLLPTVALAATDGCIAFTSASTFTLKANNGKTWDGTLEYSTGGTLWTVWNGEQIAAAAGGSEYTLLLRGTGNTVITGLNGDSNRWKLDGANIACTGNIENLLDYTTVTSGNHPTMGDCCFMWMFYNCTALTSAPDLPTATLSDGCYIRMFSGTGITKAPVLPATVLKYKCYSYMFAGCAALTKAPDLPATSLANECYQGMFASCTALAKAPALNATALAVLCYNAMFSGCTSLTKAPDLPATTLADSCYMQMFRGCTGIAMSETPDAVYTEPWSIPAGADTDAEYMPVENWNFNMLSGTGGSFTGNPEYGVSYYQKAFALIVTVGPDTATVEKGTTQQFTVDVSGTGDYDNTVTWSVEGAHVPGTVISSDGLLTVNANETAATLTVKATANGDNTKYGTATVTVSAASVTRYTLTVVDGTGDGEYESGAVVNIVANAPVAGMRFKNWTSTGGGSFADANSAATRFTMPASNVTVTANFEVSALPTPSFGGSRDTDASAVSATPAFGIAKDANTGIAIGGANIQNGVVLVVAPTTNTALTALAGGNKIVGMWDISLASGTKSVPGSTLVFNVSGAVGTPYTLYHQTESGAIESFSATATTVQAGSIMNMPGVSGLGAQGVATAAAQSISAGNAQTVVTFYPINELSPFMLVQGGGAATTSIPDVPATGGMDIGLALLLLSAAGLAVVMMHRKAQA